MPNPSTKLCRVFLKLEMNPISGGGPKFHYEIVEYQVKKWTAGTCVIHAESGMQLTRHIPREDIMKKNSSIIEFDHITMGMWAPDQEVEEAKAILKDRLQIDMAKHVDFKQRALERAKQMALIIDTHTPTERTMTYEQLNS